MRVKSCYCSGGSWEGARGAHPTLFWVKKEEITEGKKAGRARKTTPPPLSSRSGAATVLLHAF